MQMEMLSKMRSNPKSERRSMERIRHQCRRSSHHGQDVVSEVEAGSCKEWVPVRIKESRDIYNAHQWLLHRRLWKYFGAFQSSTGSPKLNSSSWLSGLFRATIKKASFF